MLFRVQLQKFGTLGTRRTCSDGFWSRMYRQVSHDWRYEDGGPYRILSPCPLNRPCNWCCLFTTLHPPITLTRRVVDHGILRSLCDCIASVRRPQPRAAFSGIFYFSPLEHVYTVYVRVRFLLACDWCYTRYVPTPLPVFSGFFVVPSLLRKTLPHLSKIGLPIPRVAGSHSVLGNVSYVGQLVGHPIVSSH